MEENGITHDNLFDGAVICRQHRNGYRFSIDSVLVAHFLQVKKGDRILDLGCGCGIISLILIFRWQNILQGVTGVEYQEGLVSLASENVVANGFDSLLSIVPGDMRQIQKILSAESFSQVVCNPPFYRIERGRRNRNSEAYIARHQVSATLEDVIVAAKFSVVNRGRVVLIYPASHLAELIAVLVKHHLQPKRLRPVYSRKEDSEAQLILVEAVKNGGEGLKLMRPLYLYRGEGREYTEEVASFYSSNS